MQRALHSELHHIRADEGIFADFPTQVAKNGWMGYGIVKDLD